MAKKRDNPASSPSSNEPAVPSMMETRRRVAEAFYNRLAKILEVIIHRLEVRILEDPGYEPKPSDIAGVMQAMRTVEEVLIAYNDLGQYVEKARGELKRLEDRFLALLSGGEAG